MTWWMWLLVALAALAVVGLIWASFKARSSRGIDAVADGFLWFCVFDAFTD